MHSDDVRARFEAWLAGRLPDPGPLWVWSIVESFALEAYRAAHADRDAEVRELVEAGKALAAIVRKQCGGYLSGPGFDALNAAIELDAALAKFTHQEKPVAYCPKCAANQPHHTDPNSSGCLHLCDVCNSVVEY